MQTMNFYSDSHLIVAAIRVLEHTSGKPPSVQDVCGMLLFSVEQGHMLCHKLHELGVIEMAEGAFGSRLFIRDHLKLEEIDKESKTASIQEEIEKFKSSKEEMDKKIETLKAEQEEKQKKLFSDIEEKLKKSMGKI